MRLAGPALNVWIKPGKRDGTEEGQAMRNFYMTCCVIFLVVCGGEFRVAKLNIPHLEAQGIELSAPGILPAKMQ